jgi:hypothetical protein
MRCRHRGRGSNPAPQRRSAGSGPTNGAGDRAHAAGCPSRPTGSEREPAVSGNGAACSPQVGDNLWATPHLAGETRAKARDPTSWVALRWKAPRVQPISNLFAEVRVKRPLALADPAKAGRWGYVSSMRSRSFVSKAACAAGSTEAYRAKIASATGCGGRSAADSPSAAPRFRDMRCPSGSGWGEALVEGRFRAYPANRTSCTRETPDARRRRRKRPAPDP